MSRRCASEQSVCIERCTMLCCLAGAHDVVSSTRWMPFGRGIDVSKFPRSETVVYVADAKFPRTDSLPS